jgi:hypothetical protein
MYVSGFIIPLDLLRVQALEIGEGISMSIPSGAFFNHLRKYQ